MIGISAVIAAITGRRLGEHHDCSDACRELDAATTQLAAAQAQIADQGTKLALAEARLAEGNRALDAAVKRADVAERLAKAEANELARLAARKAPVQPLAVPPVAPGADRRALVQLENRLALLERRPVIGQPRTDIETARAALQAAAREHPAPYLDGGLEAVQRLSAFLRGAE